MGLEGWATVKQIEACPPIKPGNGRVVLSTLTHYNGDVYQVRLDSSDEVLEPTGRHRLFSVTRGDWVRTETFTKDEQLKTQNGIQSIASIGHRPGIHRVYNIEVETEHSYFVGAAKVLSHNVNPCAATTWQGYERAVQNMYGGPAKFSARQYQTVVNGEFVNGVADNVVNIGGNSVAVEAKFVNSWSSSIRNPASAIGNRPFAIDAQAEVLSQAQKYSDAFDQVIYHSNSPEFIQHYSNVFQNADISNIQFILTK